MPRFHTLWMLSLCAISAGCSTTPTPVQTFADGRSWDGKRRFDHVLIIVLENQTYQNVLRDCKAPYFRELAERGASFTNFHGLFHPSYPNYLSMICGKELATHGDTQQDFDDPTLADLRNARGERLTWKNYAEGYPGAPGACFTGDRGRYARKHVPFVSFRRARAEGCGNIVDARTFDKDLAGGVLPQYAFYSPDLHNDGHDPVLFPSVGRKNAAAWLKDFLERRFTEADRARTRTLTVITFDESEGRQRANHIYTVFLGTMVKPRDAQRSGDFDRAYNHFNVLRTIEDNFGLVGHLGDGDAGAAPILDIWKEPALAEPSVSYGPAFR